MIPLSRISARDIPTRSALVPEHLDRNPWVPYHATTSALSELIEREEFAARDDNVFPDAIRLLLTEARHEPPAEHFVFFQPDETQTLV